jgi:transcriptional regulator with XRE-family HTH domain
VKTYFAINIQRLREFHNLSRILLAEEILVQETSIRHYENGKVDPKLSRLIRFSDIFGFTIDDLVRREIQPYEINTEQLNLTHIEKSTNTCGRPVTNIYGTRPIVPQAKFRSKGHAISSKVQDLLVLYEAYCRNEVRTLGSALLNHEEEEVTMGETRTPRRWQVLMETLEYKGKIPQENQVCQSIISVSMAEAIANKLEGRSKFTNTTTQALYAKKTYFIKATAMNAGMIPWRPRYGFEHETQRVGYFLKHHVKIKFTLQPYDPRIVSEDTNPQQFRDPLPSISGRTEILENEREDLRTPPPGPQGGQGGETR